MHDAIAASPDQRAGRREWIGLAVLALPTLLVALDIGVLFLALPHLSMDLRPSSAQQLWITDIYLFLLAGLLITMGTLGDRIGRRRLLLIGATGFTLASILAAFSTSAGMLIAARALLGVAGATMGPSTLALISNMFRDDRQRGVALSIWATCMFGGAALGPVIGGVMLDQAGDSRTLEIAGEAFTSALNVVAGIGAAVFVTLVALLAVTLLRADATSPRT